MIHVILGPPCAGKSTYIREHAQAGDVRVDFDVLASALGNATPHGATGAIKDAAYKARSAVVNYLVTNADEVEGWIIHSEPSDWQMDAYKKAGAEIVELDADLETCLARAKEDGRPEDEIAEIHKWFERHQKGAFFDGRSEMKIKTIEVKSDNGSISGYASTWTREPDSYGDVVAKGAFLDSIAEIKDSGKVLPLLYNHNEMELKNFIGTITELREDDHGLYFEADFDDTPEAQQARKLAADGRLAKFSFAYDVIDQAEVELEDGRKANELRKLNIHEVSLVMYPANDDTSVVSVKSGRRNSAKDEEKLRQIISLAQDVLGELDDIDSDDSNAKSKDPQPDNDEERKKQLIKEAESMLSKGEK